MTRCTAVSLWHGPNDDTVRLNAGELLDRDDQPAYTLKLPLANVRDRGLPMDLTDWVVTITTSEGEHIHSEVTAHTDKYGYARLTVPDPSAQPLAP